MLAGSGPQVAGRQQPPAASPAASGGGGGGGGEGPQPEWPAPEEMGSEGRAGEGPGGEVTDELILDIIQGVLSQDPDRIRSTVRQYYAPDAHLDHLLASASSAVQVYRLYRAYSATCVVQPVVRDIIIDTRPRSSKTAATATVGHGAGGSRVSSQGGEEDGGHLGPEEAKGAPGGGASSTGGNSCCAVAVVWVDQHVSLRAAPLLPLGTYPTLALLRFVRCPATGRPLVAQHVDTVSRRAYLLSLGPAARWLHEQAVQPAGYFTFALVADALDWWAPVWAWAVAAVGGWIGWAAALLRGAQEWAAASWLGAATGAGSSSGSGASTPRVSRRSGSRSRGSSTPGGVGAEGEWVRTPPRSHVYTSYGPEGYTTPYTPSTGTSSGGGASPVLRGQATP